MKPLFIVRFLLTAALATACAGTEPPPLTKARGSSPRALIAEARVHARRGDLLRSEQYFVLAMRTGAAPLEVLPELLEVCLRQSRYRSALTHAQRGLTRHPGRTDLRYLVASLHAALGQEPKARDALRQLLRQAPAHRPALALLSKLEPITEEVPHAL